MFQRALVPGLVVLALFSISLLSFSPAVQAIDDSAKTDFKSSVKDVGGNDASSVPAIVKSAINILLYAAGTIAVIVIIIGSIRFVTSEGDPARANKGRDSVVFALIGLVLASVAYAIVNFVLGQF